MDTLDDTGTFASATETETQIRHRGRAGHAPAGAVLGARGVGRAGDFGVVFFDDGDVGGDHDAVCICGTLA